MLGIRRRELPITVNHRKANNMYCTILTFISLQIFCQYNVLGVKVEADAFEAQAVSKVQFSRRSLQYAKGTNENSDFSQHDHTDLYSVKRDRDTVWHHHRGKGEGADPTDKVYVPSAESAERRPHTGYLNLDLEDGDIPAENSKNISDQIKDDRDDGEDEDADDQDLSRLIPENDPLSTPSGNSEDPLSQGLPSGGLIRRHSYSHETHRRTKKFVNKMKDVFKREQDRETVVQSKAEQNEKEEKSDVLEETNAAEDAQEERVETSEGEQEETTTSDLETPIEEQREANAAEADENTDITETVREELEKALEDVEEQKAKVEQLKEEAKIEGGDEEEKTLAVQRGEERLDEVVGVLREVQQRMKDLQDQDQQRHALVAHQTQNREVNMEVPKDADDLRTSHTATRWTTRKKSKSTTHKVAPVGNQVAMFGGISSADLRDDEEDADEENDEPAKLPAGKVAFGKPVDHGTWILPNSDSASQDGAADIWEFVSKDSQAVTEGDDHLNKMFHESIPPLASDRSSHLPVEYLKVLKDHKVWALRSDKGKRDKECHNDKYDWCKGMGGVDAPLSKELDTMEGEWKTAAYNRQVEKTRMLKLVEADMAIRRGPELQALEDARQHLAQSQQVIKTLEAKIKAQEERVAFKHRVASQALLHIQREAGRKMIDSEWAERDSFDTWQYWATQADVKAHKARERKRIDQMDEKDRKNLLREKEEEQERKKQTQLMKAASEVVKSVSADAAEALKSIQAEDEDEVEDENKVVKKEKPVLRKERTMPSVDDDEDEANREETRREFEAQKEREARIAEREAKEKEREEMEQQQREEELLLKKKQEEEKRRKIRSKEREKEQAEQRFEKQLMQRPDKGLVQLLDMKNKGSTELQSKVAQALWQSRSSEIDQEHHQTPAEIKKVEWQEKLKRLGLENARPEEIAALGLDEEDEEDEEENVQI